MTKAEDWAFAVACLAPQGPAPHSRLLPLPLAAGGLCCSRFEITVDNDNENDDKASLFLGCHCSRGCFALNRIFGTSEMAMGPKGMLKWWNSGTKASR